MTGGSDLRGEAVRSAAWSLADKWLVRVASLLTFAALGRLLTPADFGVVATAQVFIALLQTFSSEGFVQTLVVRKGLTDRGRQTAATVSVVLAVATAGAVCASAPTVGRWLDQGEVVVVLMSLSSVFIVRALGVVPTADLQSRMQFKALAKRNVWSAVISAVIGLACAFAGLGVWALVAQAISQVVIATVFAWTASECRFQFGYDHAFAVSLLRFAVPVMLADVLAVVLTQGDNLVVAVALGSVALGYYAVAFRLLNVVIDTFTGVISAVALPVFARLVSDAQRAQRAYFQATRLSFALAAPIFLSSCFAAPVVVPVAFGPQWDDSIPLFQVLCFAGVASSVLYFDRPLLIAAGKVRLELAVTVVLAAATVLAASVGVLFGLVPTAALVTARMYVTWPVRFVAVRRVIPITLAGYFGSLRGPAVSALLQAAISGAAMLVLPDGSIGTLSACALGLIGYVASLRWTAPALARDIGAMLAAARRPSHAA